MSNRADIDRMETRRDFVRQLGIAAAAALGAAEPDAITAAPLGEKLVHPRPTADACILLWMAGGMAAPDTLDPKRYVPFEVGVPADKILCTFPAIDTAVDQ